MRFAALVLLGATSAEAYKVLPPGQKIAGEVPVFLDGYDVMAYWGKDGGSAVKGSSEYALNVSTMDRGVERAIQLHFSSAANRDTFSGNVTHYMPQYGGWCAWGVCCERPWTPDRMGPPAGVDADSRGWKVTGDKLYLTIQSQIMDRFLSDTSNKQTADSRWMGWFSAMDEGRQNHACYNTNKHECVPAPLAPEVTN